MASPHGPRKALVHSELYKIFRDLDPAVLGQTDKEWVESDVALDSVENRVNLALGIYTQSGLQRALQAYGALEALERRGVGRLSVRLLMDNPFQPRVQLYSERFGSIAVDVSMAMRSGKSIGLEGEWGEVPLLYLESITLQNPGRGFTWARPRLPGQISPGLSLSKDVLQLLLLLAKRVGAEGLSLTPKGFHTARIYERYFRFADGELEGDFRALRRASQQCPLWLFAWAVELGCVQEENRSFRFRAGPMLSALTEGLAEHFVQKSYREAMRRTEAKVLKVNFDLLAERFPWDKMPQGDTPAVVTALLRPSRNRRAPLRKKR